MSDSRLLEGKVAVISGAASPRGIGMATARMFAKHGAKVAILDLDEAQAKEAAGSIGAEHRGYACNVTDRQACDDAVAKVVADFGSIDVLINNASLMSVLPRRSWLEIPVEEWDRVMAVNLRGMFLASRAVFPAMQEQKRGKIVNISSSRFFEGTPNRLHYTTSKAGVIGFTRALAREVGESGITVNAVAPGVTLSETQVASSSGNYLGTRLSGRTSIARNIPRTWSAP
jgi:NAD(P)-dependent dehydrogenase (short-subunit alcohol dehydrogenase family)